MTCHRIQSEVSRAWDEGRDGSAFEDHLSVCAACNDFASSSLEIAERYRKQVTSGIERLRLEAPPFLVRRSPARWRNWLACSAIRSVRRTRW